MKPSIALLMLLLAGCASHSPPARFYLLTAEVASPAAVTGDLFLGVGPVRLPDYLDRSQLVRRLDGGRLQVDEFHRWGGDLARNIQEVLATNLGRLLASPRVLAWPWSARLDLPHRLTLDIYRFEAGPGAQVTLDVQWQWLQKGRLTRMGRERIEVPVASDTPAAWVQAQSRALAELARRLAPLFRAPGESP